MILYIVRHGETEENQQRILQGHLPGTLSEEGKESVIVITHGMFARFLIAAQLGCHFKMPAVRRTSTCFQATLRPSPIADTWNKQLL